MYAISSLDDWIRSPLAFLRFRHVKMACTTRAAQPSAPVHTQGEGWTPEPGLRRAGQPPALVLLLLLRYPHLV